MSEPSHIPVLLQEVLEDFAPLFGQGKRIRILDGTLGLGGHSGALLAAHEDCELLGLDRDREALALAEARLSSFGQRFSFQQCRFSEFQQALDAKGWEGIDAALLDIGVSSLQLDEAIRGFSVHGDGPLDMRMDPFSGMESAKDVVNTLPEKTLRDLIASYGEDPMANRIAHAICEERKKGRIETTGQLAKLVFYAYPAAWRAKSRHHPATRTFQALRMLVNNELGELESFLQAILSRLKRGGRLAIISFHSLEDRMVKQYMKRWATDCICPPYQARCSCGHRAEVRILHKKPVIATEEELVANPRASSAKLRSVEVL